MPLFFRQELKMRPFVVFLFTLLLFPFAQAEETKPGWTNESELAIVTTSGNSEGESYSGKEKTTYTLEKNVFTNTAHYLRSQTRGTETALQWDVGLRYEFNFSDLWAAYLGYLIEADPYSGYVQRNSTDLGAKYTIRQTEIEKWFAEAGGRQSDTYTTLGEHVYATFGRLYTEYNRALSETLAMKIWLEYLPNFTDQQAYLANGEASLTAMLSKVFSLKLSYLEKYQNVPPVAGAKRVDNVFTTSLVAKF